tara:strand:+ start:688 stop:996 length:309 start_codon:yes stop_codon:yes gene_type:complete
MEPEYLGCTEIPASTAGLDPTVTNGLRESIAVDVGLEMQESCIIGIEVGSEAIVPLPIRGSDGFKNKVGRLSSSIHNIQWLNRHLIRADTDSIHIIQFFANG